MAEQFIYVMAQDGGCEGWSGPVQAFATSYEARAALNVARKSASCSMKMFCVPIWPHTTNEQYFDVKPLEW